MVAEKRTEGDIQVTQSGIPTCSGQDVLTRENYRITVIRHVNSGGRGGASCPPQCLENAIGIGKSLTSLGICWLDEDTFLGKLAMLGQLTLTGKPNITLPIC